MTLLKLCSGVFEYVCELNRAAAVNKVPEVKVIREEFIKLLGRAAQTAEKERDVALARRWKKIELPLVFFIDGMMRTLASKPTQQGWTSLAAAEYGHDAGDEEFFRPALRAGQPVVTGQIHLDQLLNTPDEDSKELLSVFYVCLGLGYRGMHEDDPDQIRKRQARIVQQIGEQLDENPLEWLCRNKTNDAYFVEKTSLPPPTDTSIALWVTVFAIAIVVILAAYTTIYVSTTSGLTKALSQIAQREATK